MWKSFELPDLLENNCWLRIYKLLVIYFKRRCCSSKAMLEQGEG